MDRATFYVGNGVTKDGVLITPEQRAGMQAKAFNYLNQEFGGFTAYVGLGGYAQGDDSVVETTLPIVVLKDVAPRQWENAAKFLRDTFDQSEVLYTVEEVKTVCSI